MTAMLQSESFSVVLNDSRYVTLRSEGESSLEISVQVPSDSTRMLSSQACQKPLSMTVLILASSSDIFSLLPKLTRNLGLMLCCMYC